MKEDYRDVCNALLRDAKETNVDFRELMKNWIMAKEKVSNDWNTWNRDEFLDCFIECKKEAEKC